MKKKWIAATILLLSVVFACACAKESGNVNTPQDLENLREEDIESAWNELEAQEDALSQSQQQAEQQWKTYECLPEMQTAVLEEAKIQIDDVVYQECYIMSIQECMDRLAGSSEEYTYEYNPDKLVTKYQGDTIDVMKNGETYFVIHAYNDTLDTISLKDAKVQSFYISKQADQNVYYFNGMSRIGAGETYTSIKERFSEYSESFQESSTQIQIDDQRVDAIGLTFSVPTGIVRVNTGGREETGYVYLHFTFKADDGECVSIGLDYITI